MVELTLLSSQDGFGTDARAVRGGRTMNDHGKAGPSVCPTQRRGVDVYRTLAITSRAQIASGSTLLKQSH